MSQPDFLDRIRAMDTWEILGEYWLDTSVPRNERSMYANELRFRGIVGARALKYRAIAAGGYWWNVFISEWGSLNYTNLVQGWCLNVLLVTAVFLGVAVHPALGPVLLLAGFRPTLGMGLRLARKREQV